MCELFTEINCNYLARVDPLAGVGPCVVERDCAVAVTLVVAAAAVIDDFAMRLVAEREFEWDSCAEAVAAELDAAIEL